MSEPSLDNLHNRLTVVESWKARRDIEDARNDERRTHMDEKFAHLERKIDAQSDTLRWLNRLVIGGIVAGVVTWALNGGLAIVS